MLCAYLTTTVSPRGCMKTKPEEAIVVKHQRDNKHYYVLDYDAPTRVLYCQGEDYCIHYFRVEHVDILDSLDPIPSWAPSYFKFVSTTENNETFIDSYNAYEEKWTHDEKASPVKSWFIVPSVIENGS